MSEDFEKRLDFDSDTFEEMKKDMNFVLQRLIGNMQEKGTNEGSMTLKIDVTMVEESIPNYDPEIKGETRKVYKPQFKHKVTSAVKINDEKSGTFNNEMELVMDEDTGIFKLVPIANTTQRSIFDADFQQQGNEDEWEGKGSDNQGTDNGSGTPLLPGPDDGVIDVEYMEENPVGCGMEAEEGLEDITDELLGCEENGNGWDDGFSYEEPDDDPEE